MVGDGERSEREEETEGEEKIIQLRLWADSVTFLMQMNCGMECGFCLG